MRRGDSYELCLTAETKVRLPYCTNASERNMRSWLLYQRLQRYNPARYSGYAGLGEIKIISSSPELFMRWDRNATFEMKPMKGTVKKTPDMILAQQLAQR
jgi:para-aminobenzoate synthetase